MLPYVANEFMKGNIKKSKSFLYDSFEIAAFTSIPIAFGLAAVSSSFVPLFFSSKYMQVIPVLVIQAFSCIVISISNVVGIQYLIPTNQNYKYTISIFIGAFTNLVMDVPLIHLWGVSGSALSIFISEFAVTIAQLFLIRKEISYFKFIKVCYKYFVAGFIMFIVTIFLIICKVLVG